MSMGTVRPHGVLLLHEACAIYATRAVLDELAIAHFLDATQGCIRESASRMRCFLIATTYCAVELMGDPNASAQGIADTLAFRHEVKNDFAGQIPAISATCSLADIDEVLRALRRHWPTVQPQIQAHIALVGGAFDV